jgi:hypothetical protein
MSNLRRHLLTLFNAFLTINSIHVGVSMILKIGIFESYPNEFEFLFANWFVPGIIAILYGLCCFAASISAHLKLYVPSKVLSIILISAIMLQLILLKDYYLVTIQLIIVAILQYILSLQKGSSNEN